MFALDDEIERKQLNVAHVDSSMGFSLDVPMGVPLEDRVLNIKLQMNKAAEEFMVFYKWKTDTEYCEQQLLRDGTVKCLAERCNMENKPVISSLNTVFCVDKSGSMTIPSANQQWNEKNKSRTMIGEVFDRGVYAYVQARQVTLQKKQMVDKQ